jgi:hypothetical protein
MMPRSPLAQATGAARFVFGIFGTVFFGVGLTVLVFMWSQSFDEFDSPPLVFRIFASFIAIAFMAMGGTIAYGAIFGGGMMSQVVAAAEKHAEMTPATTQPGYLCPNCGAALGEKADVSPLGDVKCPFCGTWFNIHRRS